MMTDRNADPLVTQIQEWAAAGKRMALATVVDTWGSSPCPAGNKMVVCETTAFVGSVSGGCIETSVVSEALEIIRDGGFDLIKYGISDEQGAAAALACGGTIRVFVEPIDTRLLEALTGPRPAARVIDLKTGAWSLETDKGDNDLVIDAIRSGRAICETSDESSMFIDPLVPKYRLIVVGAVAIAQVLVPMAQVAGFEVTIIDPRPIFATEQRFPEGTLIPLWPDKALPDLNIDLNTAVVTLTHDSKPDDMALAFALASPAFYVGALGSRKTHAKRVERMKGAGVSDEMLSKIHAPIGLFIGARTPADIAVSILSELVATKNGVSKD